MPHHSAQVQSIATDVAWSVCLSVCLLLLVTTMSCAEMDEKVKMPVWMWTRVDPRNHLLGRAQIPSPRGKGNLGHRPADCEVQGISGMNQSSLVDCSCDAAVLCHCFEKS